MLTLAATAALPGSGVDRNSATDHRALRGLVHDLRQPLSVIGICADFLNLILPLEDLRARQQLELLQQQVDEANRILSETQRNLAEARSALTV
jgi:signal transduction histidine kinase